MTDEGAARPEHVENCGCNECYSRQFLREAVLGKERAKSQGGNQVVVTVAAQSVSAPDDLDKYVALAMAALPCHAHWRHKTAEFKRIIAQRMREYASSSNAALQQELAHANRLLDTSQAMYEDLAHEVHRVRDSRDRLQEALRVAQNDNEHLKCFLRCDPEETIDDGFGSTWSRTCPTCGLGTMHVNRPGEVQCDYCG